MANPIITTRAPGVRVVASASTWIEGEALRQLDAAGALPGMREAVGMPDLHPGKNGPVGAAFLSEGLIRPALVGSDIGCGMALWQTGLSLRRADPGKVAARLDGLDGPWDGDSAGWLAARGLAATAHDASLGTVGHGNHFLEVQAVAEIRDPEAALRIGLDPGRALLLVHTGSRGLGEAVLRAHAERHGATPLRAETPEGAAYLAAHDGAVAWARANRDLVARRALEALNAQGRRLLDVCHNAVTPVEAGGCRCLLHRKGAAPSDRGPVVVPGSRGDVSVLVEPVPDRADAPWSLAHGAGRKLARHEAKAKLKGRLRREDLARNPFGGVVVCGDEHLLWEEAPGAYKPAASVVGDLEAAGLVRVVAVLHPLVTFKCSLDPDGEARADKRRRMRDRETARSAKYGER
ncbi:RNA-splicing ligase RtcB [Methylobacterium crusticola]|uniref:tRNA-splicing ligase RtcB n=1 Tax=Methylobacterium crusticola TaxID=1697972 RepID=A0ABQ4R868_9HYPH|nr:RNA ligase RtcB family protein [Methylobacterium crusticola]GJD53095.1 RNA-splicing ligase RtcB [Methylobacterium crusticola]